jgi:hypothetical protein
MCDCISGAALNEAFAEPCMGHLDLARLAADAAVRSVGTTHITEQHKAWHVT